MKFGTIKDGKFVEIKEIAEIKEPFWSSEEEREWDLKFTDPLEFKTEIVNPEALLRAIGADPGDLKNAIREEIKRTMTFIFQSNDHKARPHRKKRIAKKWAKQGRWKQRRTKMKAYELNQERIGDAVTFTFAKEER